VRATRVPPVAAMREEALAEAPPSSRRRRALTALVGLGGLALLVQGLFGGGAASSRITAMGLGSLLVFVGVALSARYVVRPLAAVVGWPLQRLGHATGELARDNATRNPARTAVTAAALMVGLALVVFVSVFAAGLKDSIDGAIADRAKAELVVTSDTVAPLSRAAGPRIDRVPSVVATAPQYLDQVQVNGRKSNAVTDQLAGIDPLTLRDQLIADRPVEVRVYRYRAAAGNVGTNPNLEGITALGVNTEGAVTQRVGPLRWEALVLGQGPLVWASNAYEKTDIEPYVHERGARVPSLRRVYKKRPYFTNGSAPDLLSVVRQARFGSARFSHLASASGEALDESSAAAIAAFVDLL